jgi:hypothetical protein
MAPDRTRSPQIPWFRQRWPWILMAGPAIVVVAGMVTLWLAIRSNDGLVSDDYYKQGIEIHKRLGRDELARTLELSGRLRLDSAIALDLHAREGVSLPADLRLSFIHPTRDGMDRVIELKGRGGHYTGPLPQLQSGQWQVLVEDVAASWRLAAQLRLTAAGEIELRAAGAE